MRVGTLAVYSLIFFLLGVGIMGGALSSGVESENQTCSCGSTEEEDFNGREYNVDCGTVVHKRYLYYIGALSYGKESKGEKSLICQADERKKTVVNWTKNETYHWNFILG